MLRGHTSRKVSAKTLAQKEQLRRKFLKRSHGTTLEILRTVSGTALWDVFTSWLFWINLGGYIIIRVLSHTDYVVAKDWPSINLSLLSILGTFMSFFVVFYVSQSYARFNEQYAACMSCEGRCLDVAMLARVCLPRPYAFRLVRHMNAAHVLGYTGLHSAYTGANFFEPFNAKFHLLTPQELSRMRAIGLDSGGGCYREAIAWAIEGVRELHKAGVIETKWLELLMFQILGLRGKLGTLFDYADQPIPFIYIHLVNFISILYLPLFAYGMARALQTLTTVPATADEIIGALIVVISNLFVVGLSKVAHKLHDPFGVEVEDLSVTHYVTFTITATRRILWGDSLPPMDPAAEEFLERSRPDLGAGFENRHRMAEAWSAWSSHPADTDTDTPSAASTPTPQSPRSHRSQLSRLSPRSPRAALTAEESVMAAVAAVRLASWGREADVLAATAAASAAASGVLIDVVMPPALEEARRQSQAGRRSQAGHQPQAGRRSQAGHQPQAGRRSQAGRQSQAGRRSQAGRLSQAGSAASSSAESASKKSAAAKPAEAAVAVAVGASPAELSDELSPGASGAQTSRSTGKHRIVAARRGNGGTLSPLRLSSMGGGTGTPKASSLFTRAWSVLAEARGYGVDKHAGSSSLPPAPRSEELSRRMRKPTAATVAGAGGGLDASVQSGAANSSVRGSVRAGSRNGAGGLGSATGATEGSGGEDSIGESVLGSPRRRPRFSARWIHSGVMQHTFSEASLK